MEELDIIDPAGQADEFFAPSTTGAVDLLLAQYAGMKARIEQVADLITGETAGAVTESIARYRRAHPGALSPKESARQHYLRNQAARLTKQSKRRVRKGQAQRKPVWLRGLL